MSDQIRVRGARQHNLKGVDVEIDRGRLTVLTGPSGSGKSSLAFDTIYAEGQRRYIESLSTYAKQFLERMPKPAVDVVEGVSPSVSIDQRNAIQSSRSTVGTVTEVYDYLRLLWSRVGTTVCPECDVEVIPDTVQSATAGTLRACEGSRIVVAFPLALSREITHSMAVANIRSQGYVRVLADGDEVYLPDLPDSGDDEAAPTDADLTAAAELLVVVDRLVADEPSRERLADSLAAAFAEGHGSALVLEMSDDGSVDRHVFQESFRCSRCGRDFPEPVPSLFSFNSPAGACDTCTGFGAVLEYAEELMVPEDSRSLADGALDPWTKPRYRRERTSVVEFAEAAGIDPRVSWSDLPEEARDVLLEGGTFEGERFRGLIPFMKSREKKRYKAYIRVFLRQYQLPRTCTHCGGTRLKPDALNVEVGGRHIADVAGSEVAELKKWLGGELGLSEFGRKVAQTVLSELADRVEFLADVGLGYLALDRQARTLSGGEMQRIRLASCLGSRLVDTLYVLDEPTIGLHPHDTDRFIAVIERLAAAGNTVLVVEHEPAVIERADDIIELGPGAGEAGGEIVFQGGWSDLLAANTSTGRALAGRLEPPARRRRTGRGAAAPGDLGWLELDGARLHNLLGVDVRIPLGSLSVVTGVSGSGKSTLVRGVLFHALERAMGDTTSAKPHLGDVEGEFDALTGVEALSGVS
ncbi:MAG: excinuclease ABC subunit A, partial [Gemmatimonadota bacterium]|nr:excinuclease ABC subunit A [Gemmatimonadota bacterium]